MSLILSTQNQKMKLLAIFLFFVKLFEAHANLQPYAYLAINADAWTFDNGTEIKRRLEMNFLNCQNFDVVLYEHEQEILRLSCDKYPDGFYITDIELPYLTPIELGYVEKCAFDYYIQIFNDLEAVSPRKCIKTNPSWMQDNADTLGLIRFSDLLLTFTHDSGAYK